MSGIKIKKGKRLGLNVMDIKTGVPVVLQILELDSKSSKKFKRDLPIFAVLNVETGEEGVIFIDGGIKGACGGESNLESMVGKAYEFTHKGLKKLDDTDQEVNVWDIFEVEIEE